MLFRSATLLDGDAFVLRRPYTASEATGVLVSLSPEDAKSRPVNTLARTGSRVDLLRIRHRSRRTPSCYRRTLSSSYPHYAALTALQVSAYNTRHSTSRNLFVRSHVAAYFISMLICEVMQSKSWSFTTPESIAPTSFISDWLDNECSMVPANVRDV